MIVNGFHKKSKYYYQMHLNKSTTTNHKPQMCRAATAFNLVKFCLRVFCLHFFRGKKIERFVTLLRCGLAGNFSTLALSACQKQFLRWSFRDLEKKVSIKKLIVFINAASTNQAMTTEKVWKLEKYGRFVQSNNPNTQGSQGKWQVGKNVLKIIVKVRKSSSIVPGLSYKKSRIS